MEKEEKIYQDPEDKNPGNPEVTDKDQSNLNEIHQTSNETQEIKQKMEVHHHPSFEKKNFMEYFREFLMLFFAVTLGFFAENLREYRSERIKEKEYVARFIKNLIQDTTDINFEIASDTKLIDGLQQLLNIFPYYKESGENLRAFCQQCVENIPHNTVFKSNDGTIVQLKNSGGFRLIIKDYVADSIVAYDAVTKLTELGGSYCFDHYNKTYDTWSHIFDLSVIMNTDYFAEGAFTDAVLPQSVIVGNDAEMRYFYNSVIQYEGTLSNFIDNNLTAQLEFARRLIPYLRKVYSIEEEAEVKE